jgi:hypothetical protein
MRTSLEVINRSAILLHLPGKHGNSVKVILGGADGPLVTIDVNGHIHVAPSVGPGDPEVRKAVSGFLQGIPEIDGWQRSKAAGADDNSAERFREELCL